MARGRKAADTSGWLKPGGKLPAKPPGLSALEQKHYAWFCWAIDQIGMGGCVDLRMVILAAELAALCDELKADIAKLPSKRQKNAAGGTVMAPEFAELSRARSHLRDVLSGLYLTPRARGSARPTSQEKSLAQGEESAPESLLRILG